MNDALDHSNCSRRVLARLARVLEAPRRLLLNALIASARFYQVAVSPMLGPHCRYTPTCSQYCILALRKHGIILGLLKTFWRILRCHPFSKGGYDPP
ncbi:MAG: membrane protein insertion efficiency factor YidD [Thermoguttaceae bacterium]|jgi:putative membrane protein insertion efficiency factor